MKTGKKKTNTRPLILLSNDDGVHSPGLMAASQALAQLGELWIVAPDSERSSCGHSMTLSAPVFCKRIEDRTWSVSGTPADAVFIAYADLLPRKPDLVVSGINRGANLGKDAFYSGTIAAAREACFRGARTLAISLTRSNDFAGSASVLAVLARAMLSKRLPFPRSRQGGGILVNVNVPPGKPGGVEWTRLGNRVYGDHVVKRESPRGQLYLWINGGPQRAPSARGTDIDALRRGLVSITPLSLDLTDMDAFVRMDPSALQELKGQIDI